MPNKNLLPKIPATMALVVIFTLMSLMFSPFKSDIQDWLALEYNAHTNELMTRPNNYLMSEPELISGKSTNPSQIITNELNLENSILDAWFDRSQTQALIVQRQGKIIYERYEADAKQGLGVNGMSMAKSVIAILIGIAIDDGLINSETDLINLYLPELELEQYKPIEIRDLLRHSSGIQSNNADMRNTLNNKLLDLSIRELSFGGNRAFSYDNINYHLLMLILQRLYQKPINEIIEAKVWQPLRLDDASIVSSAGYCCLFATAQSWLGIGNLFLNPNNTIVSKSWLVKMVQDASSPKSFYVQATGKSVGNSYGYHIYSGLNNLPEIFWIEGLGLQVIMINPKTQTIVVRLGGIPTGLNLKSNRSDSSIIAPLLKTLIE
ncbi:beta-lactamase family protein [Gammaproteobacteria bacterium]|nr:beta-lactamase family protein [Gammaproteobacteria bacterium]